MAVEPTRWGVIYNPKAGSRKAQKRWKEIRGYMEVAESCSITCSRMDSVRLRDCPVHWQTMAIARLSSWVVTEP